MVEYEEQAEKGMKKSVFVTDWTQFNDVYGDWKRARMAIENTTGDLCFKWNQVYSSPGKQKTEFENCNR